jgi:ribose transport system substrate-binding protein
MRATVLLLSGALLAVGLWGTGCRESSSSSTASATSPKPGTKKKFYWIQPIKGHPTHQMTQLGFKAGCAKLGYACEIVGTETFDIAGLIALTEQVVVRGDAAGIAIWTGNPAFDSSIEKAGKAGIPVILPHFPMPEGSVPGAIGVVSCDPAGSASEAALELGKVIEGKGTVAITQGSFNTTENMATEAFTKTLKQHFPAVKVLAPIEEGFDAPAAIAKAVALVQGNPDLTGAFSSTGNGPITWAGAQKETGRKFRIISMNYTRANLDLVKSGEVYGLIAQPLYEQSVVAAELLDKAIRHEKIPWWTKLPAPFLTQDKLQPYYDLITKIEADIK